MLQYNPSISGSLSVTGSLIVTNGVIGTVNGVDIQIFSSSISQVVTNIQTTTGSQDGRLTSIESFTSSVSTTNAFTSSTSARLSSIETVSASNLSRLNSIETITASNVARLNSIEIVSASNIARINSLETTSASVNTLNTEQNTRLTNLEIRTGSLATTGSNTFIGTQTITGSLFISANLVVQGTSSLQNITASAVSIGTNLINLNTANPAIRYAGLVIGDSGSVGGSGSFLYDSVQDEMIFVHRGASTVVTSSVTLMGPQTYDNIGNETYPTINIIQKGTGNEHLADSCIFDNGTTTCIKNNLIGTGTACFSGTITSAGDIVTPTRIAADTYNGYTGGSTPITIQTGGAQSVILGTNTCARLTITSTGVANFACRICSPGALLTNDLQINGTSSGKIVGFSNYSNNNVGLSLYNTAGTEVIYLNANVGQIGATSMASTYFSGTCLTLNGFSSGNGFKMDYGSASGQITAINLMANGTTNGFIGIQMVDGSNGDLWLGSSANRSMTIYRTGNHGFNRDAPCTRVHVEGGYGARFGCGYCFYGGGYAGGGFPYGDEFGNGAAYTYQTANTTATNGSLFGGYAAGYFKGGGGSAYGGGGAGVVAIGGNGANSESVNSGGGAGIFARGGLNGAATALSYAGWFDGGNVMVRCGFLGVNNSAPRTFVHIVGASCGADVACGFGNADARGILHVQACTGSDNSNITVENAYGIGQFMQWTGQGMRIGHRILKGGSPGDVHMTAGQDGVKLLIYANGNLGAPSGSNIYNASDCRLKKNIRTISYGLCDVMKLQPKIFNWKDNFTPSENGKEMLGFIAQDVQPIVPEVVEQFSDGSDITFDSETITNPLRVNEKFIIPILTKAIQEQQCMIDTLKSCLGIS